MGGKFFKKNFKKAAIAAACVLFAGTLAGAAFSWTGSAVAEQSVGLTYSKSLFSVTENAKFTADESKSGVKLTTLRSGTDAEGANFTFDGVMQDDFEIDFRVTSAQAYTPKHSGGTTHYMNAQWASGSYKQSMADGVNPYLDLKEVAFTFTSVSDSSKYFTAYVRGTSSNAGYAPTAYVYVPGDEGAYRYDEYGNKHYGYGLSSAGTYPLEETSQVSLYHDLKDMPKIYGTSFSNHTYGANSSSAGPLVSNLLKFDTETMAVYVNAASAKGEMNETANVPIRYLATNQGAREGLTLGSLTKEDFAGGYTVSVEFTDVTADNCTGWTEEDFNTSGIWSGYTHYVINPTEYKRYGNMIVYSVNGLPITAEASKYEPIASIKQESLISYDSADLNVTADSLNAVDNRRGLNVRSVASGTAAEGAGFAFNNVMYGNFETDFRVTSAQAYTPKHTGGSTHYMNVQYSTGSYKQSMADGVNPYLDLKEVAFTFTSATDASKYFTVFMRGASIGDSYAATAYVYVPGDVDAFRRDEDGNKHYGYALTSTGVWPKDESASIGLCGDLEDTLKIYGTSFSNYAYSSGSSAAGPLVSNLLKFDTETMAVYVNAASAKGEMNETANVPIRYLATNQGAREGLTLGSLTKEDFAGGYTVSVEFTDVTADNCTGWTEADFNTAGIWSGYTHYVVNPTEYKRYADLTIYSINGQDLSYSVAGDGDSGILDTADPVLYAPNSAISPMQEIDLAPQFYDVLGGNTAVGYGTVKYAWNGGEFTEIERDEENRYLFTPTELGTYTFVYEGFKDGAGKTAATVTVERQCGLIFNMEIGASIRMAQDNTSGIRFEGYIARAGYEWLAETYGKGNISFYYTVNANGIEKTLAVSEDKIVYDEAKDRYIMRAAVVGLAPSQYDVEFTATLYAVAGADTYTATANDNVRSVRKVAEKLLANTDYYGSLPAWQQIVIRGYVGYYATEVYSGLLDVSGHVQGTAASSDGRYLYHSMTNALVKQDAFTGEIVGAVWGIDAYMGSSSHIGDVAYYNGKVYGGCTISNSAKENCVIIIFEADKIVGDMTMTSTYTENGVEYPVVKISYVGAPIRNNFSAQNGVGPYGEVLGLGGKYGVRNAIDSTTIGPAFGADADGKYYLTLGLGAPGKAGTVTVNGETVNATVRTDNHYLVLAQYDIAAVEASAVTVKETDFLAVAAEKGVTDFANVYFFYAGYHDYGLQNLAYDEYKNAYIMTGYGVGDSTKFPSYDSFIVDASTYTAGELVGNDGDTGKILSALCGTEDTVYGTGILGYTDYWGVGVIALGNGYYYLNSAPNGEVDGETWYGSRSRLYRWDETKATNGEFPFVSVS